MMSSFTDPLTIRGVAYKESGFRRLLPPGLKRPAWRVTEPFSYAIGDLQKPKALIHVPAGFVFDGASVPLLFRPILPAAHPNYIQAAALHDWMLKSGDHTRRECDLAFSEALGVLGMPPFWRVVMYAGVRIGALRWHLKQWIGGLLA